MKTMKTYSVIEKNNKFIVAKNGEPINLPSSNSGQSIVTEFDNKQDAEKYIAILNRLPKKNNYST